MLIISLFDFKYFFQKVPTFSDLRVYMGESFREEPTSEQTRRRENHN